MSSYYAGVLTLISIQAIAALGLYIQVTSGQLNAGQAAFAGLGSYAAGLVAERYNVDFVSSLLVGSVVGLLTAGAVAMLIVRLSHWFIAVVTLAFGQAMSAILLNIGSLGGAQGYYDIPLRTDLAASVVALGISVVMVFALERTMLRRVWRAMQVDERTVSAQGLDPRWIRVVAFALGGALAGLSGGLSAQYIGLVQPSDLGYTGSLTLLVFVGIGGTRALWGTLIATFAVGIALQALQFSDQAQFLLYGAGLMIAVLVRAQGGWLSRQVGRRLPKRWSVGAPPTAHADTAGYGPVEPTVNPDGFDTRF